MVEEEEGLPHLADRLNFLFANVPTPDTHQLYGNDRAAEDLTRGGTPVTAGYIRQLRSARKRNPTAKLLVGIANLFDVPLTYFVDDVLAERIQTQLTALSRLRHTGVSGMMGRSSGLTADDIIALGPILDEIREMQGRQQGDDGTGSYEP